MDDSCIPCHDPVSYVEDRMEEMDMEGPTEENIGDFEDLSPDEIDAARRAKPSSFEELSQIELDEARRATRLISLFDISAAAARIDAVLDAINSVSVTLADKLSSAANGYGIFEVKESDEELLDEFEGQFGDHGRA